MTWSDSIIFNVYSWYYFITLNILSNNSPYFWLIICEKGRLLHRTTLRPPYVIGVWFLFLIFFTLLNFFSHLIMHIKCSIVCLTQGIYVQQVHFSNLCEFATSFICMVWYYSPNTCENFWIGNSILRIVPYIFV